MYKASRNAVYAMPGWVELSSACAGQVGTSAAPALPAALSLGTSPVHLLQSRSRENSTTEIHTKH